METSTAPRELRVTPSRVKSQLGHVNNLYNKVHHVLESEAHFTDSDPATCLARASQALKDAARACTDASQILTGCFADTAQRHPLHVERVRRRDCMVDVEQVLREFNSRLEQLNCEALSVLDLSLSTISTFNLSASPAEGPILYPRTSSPTEDPPGEPAQTSFEQRHPTPVTPTSILTADPPAFVPVETSTTPALYLHVFEPALQTVDPTIFTPRCEEPGPSMWPAVTPQRTTEPIYS